MWTAAGAAATPMVALMTCDGGPAPRCSKQSYHSVVTAATPGAAVCKSWPSARSFVGAVKIAFLLNDVRSIDVYTDHQR